MQCPRCAQENPQSARFCNACGARLELSCGVCASVNPPGSRFCNRCGTPLGEPAAPADERYVSPGAYTPKHLVDKILTSRSALEGERKQVTVLFADMKGSMELLADRDPEEARKILDPVLTLMMEAVHCYEGTVNQVMGDGIMALFGAPLAHEDHAVRACYAALRMQDAMTRYNDDVRRAGGGPIQIRVGLNSGEVVVRSIGSDLHMDYTAVGQTTHLAARTEQVATPGSVLISASTLRAAEGYAHVEVRPVGPVRLKGLGEPLELSELIGVGPARRRMDALARRGLSRFVGRQSELGVLRQALRKAADGHGGIVAVVGEPGVGKSRLFWEFTQTPDTHGWLILESGSVSYGKATAYLPVIDLLKAYFQIEDRDDSVKIRAKVTGKLLSLDRALEPALWPVLALLAGPVDDPGWDVLDPPQRRRQTQEGVKRLLLRESLVQPVLLIVEDLHWIDSETQALLDSLVESLPTARLLLLVNYRPEYQHGWAGRSYYSQVRMDPLPLDSAGEFLHVLLGEDPSLQPLKQLLRERTQGNPLFLEECVSSLVETKLLVGDRGDYRLAAAITAVQIPAGVQAVLGARVDRLPPEDKRLLQIAAVIGHAVPFALLKAIAELPEQELRSSLTRLQASEFIYEATLFPELEYTFRHSLTHEVVYRSLLRDRLRALHARVLEAMEHLYADRLPDRTEALAHHAVHGEVWDKAVDYLRRAGAKAYARGALPDTVERYEQALGLMVRLPVDPDNTRRSVDIRLELHGPLMVLGKVGRLMEVGEEAEKLARELDDAPRLGRVLHQLGYFSWLAARYRQSFDYGRQALAIAATLGNPSLRVRATHLLGLNHLALAEYPAAVELLERVVDAPDADRARQSLSLLVSYVDACGWLAFCLAALGDFERSVVCAERAVRLADASEHPQPQALAYGFRAIPPIVKGDFALALPWCERAAHICQAKAVLAWIPTVYSFWGLALAHLGHHDKGLAYLEEATTRRERLNVRTHFALFHHRWAEGLLLAGRIPEARRTAERALEMAVAVGERGHEALVLLLLGEIAGAADSPDATTALAFTEKAKNLAQDLGMRPALARSRLTLGRLLVGVGSPAEARTELTAAASMFDSMGMTLWLGRARDQLGGLAC